MFYLPVCVGSSKGLPDFTVAPVGVEHEGKALAGAASEDEVPRAGEELDLEGDKGQPVRLPSRPVGPAPRTEHCTPPRTSFQELVRGVRCWKVPRCTSQAKV